jgi:hypothetical protein
MVRNPGLRAAALAAAMLVWLAGAALAEEPAAPEAKDVPEAAAPEAKDVPEAAPMPRMGRGRAGPCHADVQKHCADQVGNPGAVAGCLHGHMDELSSDCRDHLQRRAKWAESAERMKAACAEDAKQHCPDAMRGGRLVRCLRGHEADLSDTCREALPTTPAGAKAGS